MEISTPTGQTPLNTHAAYVIREDYKLGIQQLKCFLGHGRNSVTLIGHTVMQYGVVYNDRIKKFCVWLKFKNNYVYLVWSYVENVWNIRVNTIINTNFNKTYVERRETPLDP